MLRNLGIVSFVLITSQLLSIVQHCTCNTLKVCNDKKTVEVGEDYKLIPGVGYYKFHGQHLNWNDARNACINEGAQLAVIKSDAEMEALLKLFRDNAKKLNDTSSWAWVGYHDLFAEGDWVTVTGEPIQSLGYDPWNKHSLSSHQPDNALRSKDNATANCGALLRVCGDMGDNYCDVKIPFICSVPNVCLNV